MDAPKVTPRKKVNYVDNAKFLAELKKYREACKRAKDSGREKPRMSEYLGECFLKIATHISTKANFKNYTFRDDMISDGVENCLQYVHNFNPDKSNNPFGYFTTVIHYAFLRRIQKEKKHTYIKYKLMEKAHIDGALASGDTEHMQSDTSMLTFDNIQEFVTRYDDYSTKRRARRRQVKTKRER